MYTSESALGMGRLLNKQGVCRAAWAEFRLNASYRGDSPRYTSYRRGFKPVKDDEVFVSSLQLVEVPGNSDFDEVDPPEWFIKSELGFKWDQHNLFGMSLLGLYSVQTGIGLPLVRINESALEALGKVEGPPPTVTYPRNHGYNTIMSKFRDSRARMWRRTNTPGRARRGEFAPDTFEAAVKAFRHRWMT